MPLQFQSAAWHHQQHQQHQHASCSTLTSEGDSKGPNQQPQQLEGQAGGSVPTSPAGPAGSQQQQAAAMQLHQLPSAALAAIASHLTSPERLALGRLVFGSSHAAAASAVLGTLHTCSVRRPHAGRTTSSMGQQQQPCHADASCLAAAASMPRLGRLQLELHLPQQQCVWAAAADALASMRQLSSLQLQVLPTTQGWREQQLQQQQLAQQQLAALVEAVGTLQHCKELNISLCSPEAELEPLAQQSVAAGSRSSPCNVMPAADTLQPLMQLSGCLQSLQMTTQQRLPLAALEQLASLPKLTALHLQCNGSNGASAACATGSYEETAAACLLLLMPQLHSLALIGYFLQPPPQHQPQQQQQQQPLPLLSLQGSSSSSVLELLHHLQPSKLTALDLGRNSQGCLPFPAAAHALAALTGLRSLGLAGAAVAAADLALMGQQGLRCLTRLNLSHCNDNAAAGSAAGLAGTAAARRDPYGTAVLPLRSWLGHFSCLQELALCGRAMSVQDIQAVRQHLLQLTSLGLSGALVDASTLARGLCSDQGLTGADSTRQLQGSATAQLVRLSLRGIRLGPDGLGLLTAAVAPGGLATNSSGLRLLRELDLRGCRAGGAAVAALRRVLPGLQVVQLDGMDWAEPGLEWLIGDY